MILDKISKYLYLTVLVNLSIGRQKTDVYIEMLNFKGEIVRTHSHVFDVAYLSSELYEYLELHTKESPFFYISILDRSTSQGAIPTCAKGSLEYYQDLSASEYKCFDEKWTFYTAKSDLYGIEKVYSKIGVDFIFSPFLILSNFFQDKIKSHLALFVLVADGYLCLSIFNNSEFLYAEYLDMDSDEEFELIMDDQMSEDEDDDMMSDIMGDDATSEIDLDDIDSDTELDDLEELDEFGDIADLDFIEEIDEFSESKDEAEELAENDEEISLQESKSDEINEDYQRFSLIQSSVNSFYKDEKYQSDFIENIYIADTVGVSADLKQYLEEEMFLNVYIRHAEMGKEIAKVAKMELSQ